MVAELLQKTVQDNRNLYQKSMSRLIPNTKDMFLHVNSLTKVTTEAELCYLTAIGNGLEARATEPVDSEGWHRHRNSHTQTNVSCNVDRI